MTGPSFFQSLFRQIVFRLSAKRLLVVLLLAVPLSSLAPDSFFPLPAWKSMPGNRDTPRAVANPLTEIGRQADILRCAHLSSFGRDDNPSWECDHESGSGISPTAPAPFLPPDAWLFVPPGFDRVGEKKQHRPQNHEPSGSSPPPRYLSA